MAHIMRRVLVLFVLVNLSLQLHASPIASKNENLQKTKSANIHSWETHKQFINSTFPTATKVGFDFDDTLVFSSPAFIAAKNEVLGQGLEPPNPFIFQYVTTKYDHTLTQAKKIALQLIDLHSKRGDTIYIITARIAERPSSPAPLSNFSQSHAEHLAITFNALFKENLRREIPSEQIIFTGRFNYEKNKSIYLSKSDAIRSAGVKIFYGDADSDMAAALSAKAQGIRILRSPASNYYESYTDLGKDDERILAASDI